MKNNVKKIMKTMCVGIMGVVLSISLIMPSADVEAVTKAVKAKEAYKQYLALYIGYPDTIHFAILDINNDKVPELITSTKIAFNYNIYSYVGGKVEYLTSSRNGKLIVYPNKKLVITSYVGNGGYTSKDFMKFNGKKVVSLASKERRATDYTLTKYKTTYTVKGKKSTKTKYNTYIKGLKKGAKKKSPKFYLINAANLEKYL